MTWNGIDRFYVYELVDPRSGTVFYLGYTATPNSRLSGHVNSPTSAAYPTIKAIEWAGQKVIMNIIGEFATQAEALDYEEYLISKTPGLVNRTGPYQLGKPPLKPCRRPELAPVGMDDFSQLPHEEMLEAVFEHRVEALYQAMGGDVERASIARVLHTLEDLSHEDAEYCALTDE